MYNSSSILLANHSTIYSTLDTIMLLAACQVSYPYACLLTLHVVLIDLDFIS